MEQKFDTQLRIYKPVPSICTFTYVSIIEILKFLLKIILLKKLYLISSIKRP